MKKSKFIKDTIFIALCCFLNSFVYAQTTTSCDKTLVDYVYLGELSKDTARLVLKKTPPLDTLEINYDVNFYKITYKTPAPDGHMTVASGVVAAPIVLEGTVGIVSYQHGTRFNRDDVPSKKIEKNYTNPAVFASHGGYFTVMPDYLGLGDNELSLHPYMQYETLASSSIDMLIAAKELAEMLHYPLNDRLFLTGYSEGGFSTLVMFESLATKYADLPITAVALGSAPYDWEETMKFIMTEPGPRASAYLAYFFYSLQAYKSYWTDLSQIFTSPYNILIPELFDGYHSNQEILDTLPQYPMLIFQAEFFNAILNHSESNSGLLKEYFNHYHFSPTAPLLIVGTKGDRDVPYHGAEIAYDNFIQFSDSVFIKSVSDVLDHSGAAPYILKEQLMFFKKYDH
ncbi:alpha/beta hydrolase family protein [Legionella fallonii]|uniref:Putative secreted protein n=1 Tax=Legionella fallonii LLAP-10 TaxID=1212491 RepID=A0A098G832_9GAMM|nr:hypothetical protein [Legionella fallonii]CEG58637.1 putative secreted protein [Legionella fallonii LLAP-10]